MAAHCWGETGEKTKEAVIESLLRKMNLEPPRVTGIYLQFPLEKKDEGKSILVDFINAS